MLIKVVFATLFICINGEYRGGFGPRPPDNFSPQFVQKRADNYADLITKNNQQPISAPLIPVAAPTIYRAPDPNVPIYLGGPPTGPPPFFTSTYRPTQQLSNDLSKVPRPAQANPFSERDKLFGIKPLPADPRSTQPFNPMPNLFEQANRPAVFAQQNQQHINTGVIETSKDLHIYPAKIDHAFVGGVGGPIQHNNNPRIDVPLTPAKNQREIDRFDTTLNRFASDTEVQQRQRIVLPADLANAPLESFLRRIDPHQQTRPVVSVATQSANANTHYLVSDVKIESPTTTQITPLGQGHTLPPDEVTPFTTYPDYRAEYFPELINHAHDDKRPATGRRDGPQGRFGGGTNEFREDLGIRTYGINDQRRPWEHLPNRFGNEPTNKPPNLNYKNVAIETLRNPNTNQSPPSTRLDQDLSKTQPFSAISFGKFEQDFPDLITPLPKRPQIVETTTVVGVPLYPEFGIGYQGKSGNGPANEFLNRGISPPDQGTRIELETVDADLSDGIRPYQGPEDITRSRFQNANLEINKNRGFKLDLLNE